MQFRVVSLTNASDLQVQQKLFQIGMLSYLKIIPILLPLFFIEDCHLQSCKSC